MTFQVQPSSPRAGAPAASTQAPLGPTPATALPPAMEADAADFSGAAQTMADRGGLVPVVTDLESRVSQLESVVGVSGPAAAPLPPFPGAGQPSAPAKPAPAPKPTKPVPPVDTGSVLKRLGSALNTIREQLTAIDKKIMGGAEPETLYAKRARLLQSGEAIGEIRTMTQSAPNPKDPAARREVNAALQNLSAVAGKLAKGEPAGQYRAPIYVGQQTLLEPVPSRDNPAVQSAAATLHVIGLAEDKNLARREAIALEIQKGAEPRQFDKEWMTLTRQAEDLEQMRQTITKTDLTRMAPAIEEKGTGILDQMRGIATRVAKGEPFTQHQEHFARLAAQLAALPNGEEPYPLPGPRPTPRPVPAPKPAPAPRPVPAPRPAPGSGPRPGGDYQVQPGDYLRKIAETHLGDATRYTEIVALNKDRYPTLAENPDLIYPGWDLVLPAK